VVKIPIANTPVSGYTVPMIARKLKFLTLLLFVCLAPLFGQEYGMGAILDPVRYEQVTAKPLLVTRNYTSLPRSASLKQYSPIPERQQRGTCTAWASAFAALTISESLAFNRTDRTEISNNAFSPYFLFKSISTDPTGNKGVCVSDALNFMKNPGIVKRLPTEKTMEFNEIALPLFGTFQRYPISDYNRLFSNYWGGPGTIGDRVLPVKKSLSEGKPVVIGMKTPASFHKAKDLWRPTENPGEEYGGHAMCVVSYDDDKYGGAFEIQNSWGTNWGNGGYIWISYKDFAAFVYEAYEIIENLATYNDAARFGASIQIEVYNNPKGMPVSYDKQGFYKTRTSYPSGTEFRFVMTNRHPAYVYAFAADDSTPGTERIFPLGGYSPVLDYKDSTVAWPGEYDWIQLNQVTGTDYLVVLYSKEALDIAAIERRFAAEKGTFPQRVARAVGANFIPYNSVKYESSAIEFSAQSPNAKAVFGLLLAIAHSEK